MKWPADEMTSTFIRALGHERWTDTFGSRIATALAAALAAAPAVEGWVWCEHNSDVWMDEDRDAPCLDACCNGQPCPGPHRTLLLGPESV